MSKTNMPFRIARTLCAAALLSTLSAAPAVAQLAQDAMATNLVPVTTDNTIPSSVKFSGNATLKSRLAKDPEFGKPSLVMHLDLSGVVGIGNSNKKKYFVSTNEEIVVPNAANQNIQFNVAVYSDPADPLSAVRTGVLKFALNVDTATGTITSATASAAAP
jgi:hypothetical protein